MISNDKGAFNQGWSISGPISTDQKKKKKKPSAFPPPYKKSDQSEGTNSYQRPIPHVRVLVRHQMHHPSLCSQLVHQPKSKTNPKRFRSITTRKKEKCNVSFQHSLLPRFIMFHIMSHIGTRHRQNHRVIRVFQQFHQDPTSSSSR